MQDTKRDIISQLRKEILIWEGFKPGSAATCKIDGLKTIELAFPNGTFPFGTIHEFLSFEPEQAAASGGFIAGLMSMLMNQGGISIWIGTSLRLFPPALTAFGLEPHRVIFIDIRREKDVLWATEEALKCKGISAVIAQIGELTFMQSRRLQLAVETSKVTGFIVRNDRRKLCTTASTARWQITPVPSQLEHGMPGVGFPRWQVELLKVRNGKPGSWRIEWTAGAFNLVSENILNITLPQQIRKVS